LHHCPALITCAFKELLWGAQSKSREVSLFEGEMRYWDFMCAVEVQFLLNDAEGFLALLADHRPVEDIVRNVLDSIRELCSGDRFLHRKLLFRSVIPGESLSQRLFLREREVVVCRALVVSEARAFLGQELPPFSCFFHMINNL